MEIIMIIVIFIALGLNNYYFAQLIDRKVIIEMKNYLLNSDHSDDKVIIDNARVYHYGRIKFLKDETEFWYKDGRESMSEFTKLIQESGIKDIETNQHEFGVPS
jgi:hypothetical protein